VCKIVSETEKFNLTASDRILHRATRWDFARGVYGKLRGIPLIGGLAQKLVHSALPPGTKLWVRIPEGLGKDLWIYADPRFELGYTNGDHEPWLQQLLKSELRSGDCFYDVGAHTGFFALIASRFIGSTGSIVAFEPDPDNVATLQANIARNGISQVALAEAAVWSSPGEVTFERALGESNRTQGHILTEPNAKLARISVKAVRLDDLIFNEGYPHPQLMKMDVEGAEWDALQGASRMLGEIRPKLLCEIHDPAQMDQIQMYLRQFGYQAEAWNPVHEHYADYRQLYLWAVPSVEPPAAAAEGRF
jgi:FkbM family methyltransferase